MNDEKKMSFEEGLNKLEEIVKTVESETLPLEENLKLFEEGMSLIKDLEKRLSEAEQTIAKIVNKDSTVEEYKD